MKNGLDEFPVAVTVFADAALTSAGADAAAGTDCGSATP
jgi:hypothetical protein